MKLSIIVPIYNVAPYLRKCVDSLITQDISDYEIILVDDGSTDNSGMIADEYKPTPSPSLKGGVHNSFARVYGAHTADSTRYDLLKENAKANRKNPTEAESVMWDMLKGNNLGYHFRRQHIILDYIVDFVCLEKGLVIELDGGYHNDPQQKAYDGYRTAHLQRLGYTELRFKNEELLCNPDSVIQKITETLEQLPSLQGRGGDRLTPLPFREETEVGCQIKVIHQANAGLSAARNTGISLATGKYILFVDSDDYLQPNTLGTLLEQAERDNLDVLRFCYQNVKESGEAFAPYNDMTNYNDYSAVPTDGLIFLNERMGNQCYAWQFVVKAEIVRQELFTPGIYFEDTDWTPRMLLRANRVASTDLVVYNYLWREGSITLSQKDIAKMRKQLDDKMAILGRLNEWGKTVSDRRWFDGMISGLVINIVGIIASTFYQERKQYIKQIKALNILPITTYHIAPRAQRKVKLINLSINFAVWLLHIKS